MADLDTEGNALPANFTFRHLLCTSSKKFIPCAEISVQTNSYIIIAEQFLNCKQNFQFLCKDYFISKYSFILGDLWTRFSRC